MAILTGNGVRAALIGTYDGQEVVNVLHFKSKDDSCVFADFTTAIEALLTSIKAQFCNAMTWTNIRYTTLDVIPEIAEANITQVGTAVTDGLPGLAPLVLSWRSQFSGRRYRGRSYLSGLPENNVTRGVITQASQDTLQTAVNTWLGTYGLGGSHAKVMFCIYSRVIGQEITGLNGVATALVRTAIGSMRSRRFGS